MDKNEHENPVSGGEGEAVAEAHSGSLRWLVDDDARPANAKLYTHPSDPSATEEMRAALEPFDVTGIPEWGDDEKVYLSCDGNDLDFIALGDFRRLAKLRAALGEA